MIQRLTDFLLKPFRSLTGGEIHPSNSLAVAHAFVQDFQLTYAQEEDTEADLPPFLPTKWDDVLRTSKADGKFVLVYLHSNYHQHSQMFCEEALKDAGVLEFMHSGELLVWGANVSHRDGSEVAGYLKACSYPFMAVCMKHQSGALLVLDRVEGISSLGNDGSTTLGGKLLARLKDVVTRNQQVVSQVQAVNRAETERRTFRQQQDQEYENTLRADRERREQQEATAIQARQEQEDAARIQEEQETQAALEEAMEMSRQLSQEQKIERLKQELPEEPPRNASRKNTTKLKVRLGSGAPIMRSFYKETTIRTVRNWVEVEMSERGSHIIHFRINCNMPKVSYGEEDTQEEDTLESTGLHPSAMLYVQDMDS